ncbi:Mut7-C RNAse domain-containing protein [Accumulibacter sp.]|uniref:Mut7-C RNAse domain-containing protein n=1 Tax=Accumulibacter sp. TaxID=2053492 RepID=UPI003458B199
MTGDWRAVPATGQDDAGRPLAAAATGGVATFRFYGELNDFLAAPRRQRDSELRGASSATVKHLIETLGVPHTEVELILVNGRPVDFAQRLQAGDRVAVYPAFTTLELGPLPRLRPAPPADPRFVVDAHLGGLARLLRLAGFDTVCDQALDDAGIAQLAADDERIVLSRDRDLLERRAIRHGGYVHAQNPDRQLVEILARFDLAGRLRPFSRCLQCNAPLLAVDKALVLDALPPRVRHTQQEFSRCAVCRRVYWPGSHWQQMRQRLAAAVAAAGRRRRPPALDCAALFSAAARQREIDALQRTMGTEFGLTFVHMDIHDAAEVAAVVACFARAKVNGSAAEGRRFARGVTRNPMLAGQGMAPVAAWAASGVEAPGGKHQRFALIAFNTRNNQVMEDAFGDLRPLFGADAFARIERLTLLHETAHVVVHHAEQSGADAWAAAVAARDAADGQAGAAIRDWAGGPQAAIAHPDLVRLLLGEADALAALQARLRAGEDGLTYDADRVRDAFQAIKARADYRNFQENMADAFMAIVLRQEGVDLTGVVGAARAAGDAEHDSQPGLAAVGALPASSLDGLNLRQSMALAAQLVRRALGLG